MKEPGGSVGVARALGLVASSGAVMFGLVLAANVPRYGLLGLLGGLALLAGGVILATRLLQQPSSKGKDE